MTDDNWINPNIRVGESPIHGKGMFAYGDIGEGEVVSIWRKNYTDKTGAVRKASEGLGVMQWDEDVFSFEHAEDPDDYVINHSCDPNTWMKDAHTVTARRSITRGEEVTIDYAVMLHDLCAIGDRGSMSMACHCGDPACRDTVTTGDWRIRELQERYRGHFSPLLNKAMAGKFSDSGTPFEML
jgi:hypothetical protein